MFKNECSLISHFRKDPLRMSQTEFREVYLKYLFSYFQLFIKFITFLNFFLFIFPSFFHKLNFYHKIISFKDHIRNTLLQILSFLENLFFYHFLLFSQNLIIFSENSSNSSIFSDFRLPFPPLRSHPPMMPPGTSF